MSPEEQASLLTRWLAAPAGQAPPEGLDPEVVETVYALRPERAPAPRVSLDDILAGVSTGPFAAGAPAGAVGQAAVGEAEAGAGAPGPARETEGAFSPGFTQGSASAAPRSGGEVVDFAAARARRNRLLFTVGSVAAAAMVLFTVMPLQRSAEQLSEVAVAPEARTDAPAPGGAPSRLVTEPTEPRAQRPADPSPLPDAAGPKQRSAAPPPPAAAPAAASPATAVASGRASGGASYDTLDLERTQNGTPAPLREEPALTGADEDQAEAEAVATEEQAGAVQATPTQSVSPGAALRRDEASRAREKLELLEEPAPAKSSLGRSESKKSSSANVLTPPAAAPATDDSTLSAADARASAWPQDYSASWLGSLGDAALREQALRAEAEAAALSGVARAERLAQLIPASDARVGQDFAGRAAQAALIAGRADLALRYVDQGLRRGGANTPFLAMLYYQQGQAYERQGNPEAAQRAYTQAAALNASR